MFPEQYKTSIEKRLIAGYTFEPNTGCWLWTGATNGNKGYGIISLGARTCRPRKQYTHRLMYYLYRGYIPAGLQLRHTCDTSCCGNPDHLIPGTCADNTADMLVRGRSCKGRSVPALQRLSDAAVAFIRIDTRKSEAIAAEYGITPRYVLQLKQGVRRVA